MDGREFYGKVQENQDLEWLGSRQGSAPLQDEVIIGYRKRNSKFAVSVSAIKENSWDELLAVMTGQRGPRVMTHITRIVGYYSQLQNWNRSKLAELRDRHRGNYTLPEPAVAQAAQPVAAAVGQVAAAVA